MHQTFDQYCEELKTKSIQITDEAEMRARYEHLWAFNFGRSIQRLEDSQRHFWLRVCWLLMGLGMGAALVAGYLQIVGGGP